MKYGLSRLRAESPRGYTLLEICLVIFIIALMVGASVPVISNLFQEERLRGSALKLELYAVTARRLAVMEGKAYEVRLTQDTFLLHPLSSDSRPDSTRVATELAYKLPGTVGYRLQRWGEEVWNKPDDERWIFQPSGLCEPLSVQFTNNESWLTLSFNPLTASVREETSYFP